MPRKSIKNETVDLSIETPKEEVKEVESNSEVIEKAKSEPKTTTKKPSTKPKTSSSSKTKESSKKEEIEEISLPGEIITVPEDEEPVEDVIIPNIDEEEMPVEKETKEKDQYQKYTRYLNVNKDEGLTSEIVIERVSNGLNNITNNNTTKTPWQIIRSNVFTFFNMLYIVVTVLLILSDVVFIPAGEKASIANFTYLIVVIFNTTMSIVQEFKAKKMIEKLNLVQATKALVVRDGKQTEVPNTDVVLDDVVIFKIGNQIYADSVVLDGSMEVNESMITGESDSIVKNPGDKLYSGSYVVSGMAYARVDHVGKDNYIEKLALEAKQQKGNKSELLRTLNWIVKIVGFIIVPLFIVEFFKGFCNFDFSVFNGMSMLEFKERFHDTVGSVSGSVIGMIPAGLFLLTTIALTQGVYKLGKQYNTSVQELYCIEMLARVDTLCLDKTGTITDGTMRVVDCIEIKNNTEYSIREIVGSMMSSFGDTNATSEALIRFFSKNKVLKPTAILPFSSKRKYSAVTFKDVGTFYLGAPEFILLDNYDKVKPRVDKFAAQGCRVIAVGHTTTGIKKEGISSSVKPIALIVIQDHIRDEAYETIEFFRQNGVDVKVISGDNPITVSEIAHRAGIAGYNRYISLEGLTDDEVKEIAFDYTIFGRVTPSQKRALVEAFKEKKRTVAMTGDGVNDILAMKEADCSIAMASGSEATRNISNIVLMDSNFASMPKVVAEGRRVINNVQRTSTLFLTKTLLIFFITIMYVFALWKDPNWGVYPFTPSQMMLIEMVIIGFPSTIISILPNKEKVQGKFILNVLKAALPGALTVLLFHIIVYVFQRTNKLPELGLADVNVYKSVVLIITIGVSISVLYRMCKPFNIARSIIFTISLVVSVLWIILAINGVALLNSFLSLTHLNLTTWLFMIICLLLINPILSACERFINLFSKVKISN